MIRLKRRIRRGRVRTVREVMGNREGEGAWRRGDDGKSWCLWCVRRHF